MKICELRQHCGECKVIHLCAEPFSELCLCTDSRFSNIEEEEYIKLAEKTKVNVNEDELKNALEDLEDEFEISEKIQELINMNIADEIAKRIEQK